MKIIKKFDIDTGNIPSGGERRRFSVLGDNNCVFKLEITNEDSPKKYYNFSTEEFTTTKSSLRAVISGGIYSGDILFPSVSDDDHYDIYLWADSVNTKHANYREVRFTDGSIDINSSSGSSSKLLQKIIRQYTSKTFTVTAAAPTLSDSGEAFEGATIVADTISVETNNRSYKKDFTVTVTADTNHVFAINRQPVPSDAYASTSRIIGAFSAIPGEDVSSSTYYRWAIKSTSTLHGLANGMQVLGTNVTANTEIADYDETLSYDVEAREYGSVPSVPSLAETVEESVSVTETVEHVDGIDTLGFTPTLTNGSISKQLGNITFNNQQAAALADDTVVFYAYGPNQIKKLTGNSIKLSNLKVELTDVTTTINDASATGSASLNDFDVTSVAGIMDDVSVVTGVNINASAKNPLVTTISSNNLTLTPGGHYVQNGQTLVFKNASTIATITGTVEITNIGDFRAVDGSSVAPSITFNLEKFLKAV